MPGLGLPSQTVAGLIVTDVIRDNSLGSSYLPVTVFMPIASEDGCIASLQYDAATLERLKQL